MTNVSLDDIVSQYLKDLDTALEGVPAGERRQLIGDISDHIAHARGALEVESEAALREILDRVGPPSEIAGEARAGETPRILGRLHGAASPGSIWRRLPPSAVAVFVVLLVVAGVLAFILPSSAPALKIESVAPTATLGGFPTGIALDSANHTIYVGDGGASLSVLNSMTCNTVVTSGCASVAAAATGGNDPIGVAVDERTGTVYAVNGESNTVAVINAATCNAIVTSGCSRTPTRVDVPGGPEFLAVDEATNTIYVADTSSGQVAVIDGNICDAADTSGCAKTPLLVNTGSGAFPIAVDQSTNTILVGGNASVAAINGNRCDSSNHSGCGATAASLAVASGPAGIAIDESTGTAYVSSESGTVSVLHIGQCSGSSGARCLKLAASVKVGADARGDAILAGVHTLYVTDAAAGTVSLVDTSACNATVTNGCSSIPKSVMVGSSPRRVLVDPSTDTAYVVNVTAGSLSLLQARYCNVTDSRGCPSAAPATNSVGLGSGASVGAPVSISGGPSSNSNCSPTTVASSSGGPAGSLEASASKVASGTVDGAPWSLWSENGQGGATGLEDGGVVINGRAYGLCPGFSNPAELEIVDVGARGIAFGIVGYPGLAKVQISKSSVGTFTVGPVLPAPTVQVVKGVSFFIGTLPKSACSYPVLELNTTSPSYSAEHNLDFGSCVAGQLVSITASQGQWQLAPGQFTQSLPGASASPGTPASTGGSSALPNVDDSCSAGATMADSGQPKGSLTADSTEADSGTLGSHSWSLWAAKGSSGVTAIEQGGFVLDGRWYGMCPGAPNPGEYSMIDSSPTGIIYGYVANPGDYSINFTTSGVAVPPPSVVKHLDGGTFFIVVLPKSACSYSGLNMEATAGTATDEHEWSYGACRANDLVVATSGSGSW